ncbi:hypothetical protein BN1723_008590 [Verticillium longisporum]|uniref:CFEM domain-containing protein n=2 Tax=Verticillium longisporum TaxID=100787 RepID=A0A0G4KGU5_VERLO|nr:hypothetical protein BN1723_008590 [Verticillium longisporum]
MPLIARHSHECLVHPSLIVCCALAARDGIFGTLLTSAVQVLLLAPNTITSINSSRLVQSPESINVIKMKNTAVLSAAALLVLRGVQAQDLPACGQTCVNNMLGLAAELGCGDVQGSEREACLCRNPNFLYGINDCSTAVCAEDTEAAAAAVRYGLSYCADRGVTVEPVPAGTVTEATNTETVTATGTGGGANGGAVPIVTTIVSDGTTLVSTIGTGTVTGTAGGGAVVPIVTTIVSDGTTLTSTVGTSTITGTAGSGDDDSNTAVVSTFTTVITSGDNTITSTGVTTIGINGVSGASQLPVTTVAVPVVTTITSGDDTITSTIGTTSVVSTLTGSALTSALESQASDAASTGGDDSNTASGSATTTDSGSSSETQTGDAAASSTTGGGNDSAGMSLTAPAFGLLAAMGVAAILF